MEMGRCGRPSTPLPSAPGGCETMLRFPRPSQDKMKRIRVPLPQVEDRRKVLEEVTADRKPAIEAAIVRVMKMRKVLQHQQLMIEVRQQMQSMFEPEMKLVKKCVEGLIEREYLERDAENPSLYKYLA